MNLRGNTIFITGGGLGIGRGLAEAFHRLGNKIIIGGRRPAALNRTVAANPGMDSIVVDTTSQESVQVAASDLVRKYPQLNVVVNNAGVQRPLDFASGEPLDQSAIGTLTVRLPHEILRILNERYESGLLLQDTTYSTTSPFFLPYSESYATTDLIAVVPIRAGMSMQAGVKNLLDRNYYYTAGYPEEGRNWFFNLRYRF